MPKTYTLADWQKLALKRGKVDVISIAKEDGRKSRLLVRCKTCGYENIIMGYGLRRVSCKQCRTRKPRQTSEQAILKLNKVHPTLKFKDFTYVNCRTRVAYVCLTCGLHHEAAYLDLFNGGCGCPRCAGRYIPTTNEARARLIRLHPTLDFNPFEYTRSIMRIKYRCTVCNLEHEAKYSDLIHCTNGCPRCAGKYSPTTEEARALLEEKHQDLEFYEFIYKSIYTKVLYKCKKCGFEKTATYCSILKGYGCTNCNASQLEINTAKVLSELSIPYSAEHRFNACKSKGMLPFDFYIESMNLIIECHGRQHYECVDYFNKRDAFEYRKHKDAIKLDFCKNNGINILFVIARSCKQYKDVYNPTIFIDELKQTLTDILHKAS